MPFVRIDLQEGKSEAYLSALSKGVLSALQSCFDVPERDHFQIVSEHKPRRLIHDAYFDIEHSEDFVMV